MRSQLYSTLKLSVAGALVLGGLLWSNNCVSADSNTDYVPKNIVSSQSNIRTINGQRYLFDSQGNLKFGQQFYQGHWYLFDPHTGAMQYGRQYIADQNKWVLYDRNDGTMQYGQQYDQGHWYLFDSQSGAMQYGRQYIADQNKWVLYDRNDGTMQYGQQYDQGHWYLFDSQSGAMQYGRQYIADQNKWVLYDRNDGTMQYGQQYDQGHWYLFDPQSGAMRYGWQQLPQGRVYYDQHDGTIQYGTKYIDGVEYSFNIYNGAQETGHRQIMIPNTYTYGAPGLCLQYVDDAFNIYSNRSYSAKVAADKAGRAGTMHYNDQFPVGIKVPVYWNLVSKDDGINYGHIAIWDGQGGFYWEGNNSSLPNYFTRDEMQQIMNGTRPVNGHYLTENWYTPVLIGWSTSLEGTVIAE